jgi:FAD/FMN-containing dehydrogenase
MMTGLDDRALDAFVAFATDPPLPWSSATFECYGDAMNRVDATSIAFPHRDARYQAVISGVWDDPADDEQGRAWTRDLYAAIEPYGKTGSFLNFIDVDGSDRQERIRAGYGRNWDRLVEVKRRYDPDNVFHRNNNVTP